MDECEAVDEMDGRTCGWPSESFRASKGGALMYTDRGYKFLQSMDSRLSFSAVFGEG